MQQALQNRREKKNLITGNNSHWFHGRKLGVLFSIQKKLKTIFILLVDSFLRRAKTSRSILNEACKEWRGLPRWLSGKNLPADVGDTGLIPGLGRSPGEGNGNPFQYSCLGNPSDRGTWWATVHGVTRVGLQQLKSDKKEWNLFACSEFTSEIEQSMLHSSLIVVKTLFNLLGDCCCILWLLRI